MLAAVSMFALAALAGLAETWDSAGDVVRADEPYRKAITLATQAGGARAAGRQKRRDALAMRSKVH